MAKPVAVIIGAGSKHDKDGSGTHLPATSRYGLGGALSMQFSKEYHVVLMGRRLNILQEVGAEVEKTGGEATCVQCDVSSDDSVAAAFAKAKEVGEIAVLVFNASAPFPEGTSFGNFPKPAALDPTYMQFAFNITVCGAIRCVKCVMDDMLARGSGTILLSGATMSLRGGAAFAAMSPMKFALRSYGQSLYQEYAPQGIHVAHVIIDGVIESPNTEAWGGSVQLQNPADLADAFVYLVKQPPTTWTYELQLSPQRGGIGMRL